MYYEAVDRYFLEILCQFSDDATLYGREIPANVNNPAAEVV